MVSIQDSLLKTFLGLSFLLVSNALPARARSPITVMETTKLAQGTQPITKANWQQHPKIEAVRSIVESVNAGLKRGAFNISVRKFEYCESYEDTLRKIVVDSKGIVRRYENEAGSDDSALRWQHYYDQSGRLRFVFISGGAVNGSQLEHRVYFDENGNRVWEEHKYLKGPGYTFPEVWPEEKNDRARPIQKSDPAKAFAATSPCPEIKSGSRRSRK